MIKVKALYTFVDKKANRNRKKGEIFRAPKDWAKELVKNKLVESLEPKKEEPKKEPAKKEKK